MTRKSELKTSTTCSPMLGTSSVRARKSRSTRSSVLTSLISLLGFWETVSAGFSSVAWTKPILRPVKKRLAFVAGCWSLKATADLQIEPVGCFASLTNSAGTLCPTGSSERLAIVCSDARTLLRRIGRPFDQLQRLLVDITPIALSHRAFSRVQLHRNNRHYRLLLHVCELLFDGYLPASGSGPGHFYDVLKNETKMARLFERFVLNFANRHCRDASVPRCRSNGAGHGTKVSPKCCQ